MCLVDKEIVTIMFVCREEGKRGVSSQVVCGIILWFFFCFFFLIMHFCLVYLFYEYDKFRRALYIAEFWIRFFNN